jgi:rhodanese-related sulfurtransferase
MKKVIGVSVALVFVLSMLGFALAQEKKPSGPPPVVQEMVAKARSAIKVVPAADVKAMIDKKENLILLDVRDGGEYSAGYLPGAINISRGTLEFNVFSKIPDQNAKIYVYCKTKARSTLATKTLNDLGYKNAMLVDISFEDWVKAGYPVAR